jgi:hypothetical protein
MRAVVGVVRELTDVKRIVEVLRDMRIPDDRISVLLPESSEAAIRRIPTTDAEQPGIAQTIGGVVGGATGSAGALAVASIMLPGVGPVVAAGAIALGLLGSVAGGAVGSQLDNALSRGLPTDELYVYRDALRKGRMIVVAMAEDEGQAARVREAVASLGAESVDAAREEWWLGLRDAEEAEYARQGGDFRKDETLYRTGFDAAFRDAAREDALPLGERYGPAAEEPAFRAGYARGRAYCAALAADAAARRGTP